MAYRLLTCRTRRLPSAKGSRRTVSWALRFGPIDEEIARYHDAASLCLKVASREPAHHMKVKLLRIAAKFENCALRFEGTRPKRSASADQ